LDLADLSSQLRYFASLFLRLKSRALLLICQFPIESGSPIEFS
jgi:hypothetical protein